jgi:outer membrane protein assembly factor BamB
MKLRIEIHDRPRLVAAIALAALGCSLRAHAADWPLVRGDAAATGAAADVLPRPLDLAWTYESAESAFEATPAIVKGVVYVGDADGTFHAVNLADGSKVWTKSFEDSGFVAGTAVAEGRIFCVDFNGVIRALSTADGEQLWEFPTETSLYAAPNVYEGRVLVATDAGELIALDAATGKETWERFRIDQPLRSWPTVVEGRILVAGCDGLLHAVDVATGKDIETIDIGGPADGMPAVLGDMVYFCTAGGVFHAMKVKPLEAVWKYGQEGQSEEIHAAAVTEAAVVLGTHDKRVVALNPKTGDQLWELPLRARAESSPVIVGDLAIAATIRGHIHAIDVKSGKEVWSTEVGGRFTGSAAVSNGRVVLPNDDGVLYCVGGSP